ncbi:MAG TPA: NADH-quinone oxidoreductase subunit H [Propioniciclava tarda]|nr:NADH-quinone oxidoreductase subunit H [Propioniciclava tarda]HQA30500.1 NADH-quinone oxidoreductase subunit H [Propioniciclava tarda]HQD61149.1 NADH-quinone oxidoreductase subunit H [Propioniciclava tarda]
MIVAVALVLQVVAAVALTPVLIGVMRQVRTRLEGRQGPGIGQPWRDVRKLLAKEPLQADGSSWVLWLAPALLVISSLVVVALIPMITTASLAPTPPDLFVVVSFLLIGTVALALLGVESGTAFGGMGSSRHMMIAALVEPTVLISVYALSIPAGSSSLASIIASRQDAVASVMSPAGLLAIVALFVVVLAECGRLPVDNPSTHLELTMVHEAMILESAGRDLAWLELGSWLRLTALLGLVVNLAVPWGIAPDAAPLALLIGLLAFSAKLIAAGAAIAAVEVFLAKIRLFRVPELLAGSFVMAFLAVTASYLVA